MPNESSNKNEKKSAKKIKDIREETLPVTDTKAKAKKSVKAAPEKAAAKKSAPKKAAVKKSSPKKDGDVKVVFQLTYGTHFGQNIYLSGNVPQLGGNHEENALPLHYKDHLHWAGSIQLNKSDIPEEGLKYYYIIQNEDGSVDKSAPYVLYLNDLIKDVHVFDAWNYTGYLQNAFTSKVFEVLNDAPGSSAKKGSSKKGSHRFKVTAPSLPADHALFIAGGHDKLGNWNAEEIILLEPGENTGVWSVLLDLAAEDIVEYKYGIYDTANKTVISFEEGENRLLSLPESEALFSLINDGFLRYN